jgi:hypothetical protein
MAVEYSVKANEEQLADAKRFFEFIGGNTSDVIRIAINKAGPIIRTEASKQIRSQVRLKAAYVKGKLSFVKATRGNLTGQIRTPSRGLLLTKYLTDTTLAGDNVSWVRAPDTPARGIRVKVKPNGVSKIVTGGNEIKGKPFFMTVNGNLFIAGRRALPGPRGGKIKVFNAASLSQVFNDVKDDVLPYAAEVYTEKQIDAMRYLLTKRRLPT